MALSNELRNLLENSELTFEEVRAFESGLVHLTRTEQEDFVEALKKEPDLIYPLYINFKAKLRAAHGSDQEWRQAIETEIIQLEDFLSKKKVGDEIK